MKQAPYYRKKKPKKFERGFPICGPNHLDLILNLEPYYVWMWGKPLHVAFVKSLPYRVVMSMLEGKGIYSVRLTQEYQFWERNLKWARGEKL